MERANDSASGRNSPVLRARISSTRSSTVGTGSRMWDATKVVTNRNVERASKGSCHLPSIRSRIVSECKSALILSFSSIILIEPKRNGDRAPLPVQVPISSAILLSVLDCKVTPENFNKSQRHTGLERERSPFEDMTHRPGQGPRISVLESPRRSNSALSGERRWIILL